jgi:DNA-binding XRE family transcriptional regulator
MSPDEIKALRGELGCTTRELGTALGVDQETILAWERGDLFPTKRLVGMLDDLRKKGPDAIPKKKRGKQANLTPFQVLATPEMWTLIRKILGNAELRAAATKLSEGYPDPADEEK